MGGGRGGRRTSRCRKAAWSSPGGGKRAVVAQRSTASAVLAPAQAKTSPVLASARLPATSQATSRSGSSRSQLAASSSPPPPPARGCPGSD